MKQAIRLSLIAGLALGSTALFTSCNEYYPQRGYHHGHGAYNAAPYGRKLKPKEKAQLGYGRHAGHPQGGPPGQMKKRYGW